MEMQGHLQFDHAVHCTKKMQIYFLFTFFCFGHYFLRWHRIYVETLHCKLDRQNKNKHLSQQVEMSNILIFCWDCIY